MLLYFVATSSALPQARKLARKISLSADHVLADTRDAMGEAYQPTGLTAVLVYRDGLVRSINPRLGPGLELQGSLKTLSGASPEGLDRPGGTVLLAGQAGLRPA